MQRAIVADDKRDSDRLMGRAEEEIMSQYVRLDLADPMLIEVTASIARLHTERGDFEVALEFLEKAIDAQPNAPAPYAHAAVVYRKAGDIEKGLNVLRQGDVATNGTSAELNYFLGLFYVETNDLDSAVTYARRAYELGYPLPGLATKLRRRGRPLE